MMDLVVRITAKAKKSSSLLKKCVIPCGHLV